MNAKRKLLAQTVSIGFKLIKINTLLAMIGSGRPCSTIESPLSPLSPSTCCSPMSPEKAKKKSLLFKKRSNFHIRTRTTCLPKCVKNLILDEPENNFSIETMPEIPADMFSLKNFKEPASLLMKKNLTVRTRRKKNLSFQDLEKNIQSDIEKITTKSLKNENSCVPFLHPESRFFYFENLLTMKETLKKEYIRLVNFDS